MDKADDFGEINSEIGSLIMEFLGNKDFLRILFIVGAILAVALLCFVIYIIVHSVTASKTRKQQNKQFRDTLDFMHSIHTASNKKSEEGDVSYKNQVHSVSDEVFSKMITQCEKLGEKIDRHTDRENNSKKMSELVYKISLMMGLDNQTAQLYFCIALVYDAGFLDFDPSLFRVEILSAQEKSDLKTHVFRASSYYTFIPEELREVFTLAAILHHENMNGTGYPEGLRSETIPLVSRILHTAESYISLTSPRRYHQSRDKESAISDLRHQPGIYDSDIVDALEKVI